jgi:hypothetical protein
MQPKRAASHITQNDSAGTKGMHKETKTGLQKRKHDNLQVHAKTLNVPLVGLALDLQNPL